LFAQYAGSDPDLWKMIEGQAIIHTSFGPGVVVAPCPEIRSDTLYIRICFQDDAGNPPNRQFTTTSFGDPRFFSHLTLPDSLAGIESTKQQMQRQSQIEQREERARERQQRLIENLTTQREQERCREIKAVCRQRNITTLVHFTRVHNLHSILEHGLLSRSRLEALPSHQQPIYTDRERLEGCKDAISVSISFPNYRMFYKYSHSTRAEWVILLLEASVLWELDCAFCPDNAANSKVAQIPLMERKLVVALKQMFEDCANIPRRNLPIPPHYTTNPQAEVLVFDPIPCRYIREVHFYELAALRRWRDNNTVLDTISMSTNETYFRSRQDFETWRPAQD
jgi:hypothetical protein